MLPVIALAIAGATPVGHGACRADHARYVLRADPSVTLRFHVVRRTPDWRAGLVAELRLAKTGRTTWWLPTAGDLPEFAATDLRRRRQAGAMHGDRKHALRYFGFDRSYRVLDATVGTGQPAPRHILLDSLRLAFRYQDDVPFEQRSSPPASLFDLVACDVPGDTPDILFPAVP